MKRCDDEYLHSMRMAFVTVLTLGSVPWLSGVTFGGSPPATQPAARETSAPGAFAVLELFTSEGCSSCPPAEELLARIDKSARQHDMPVYALAFHVDYFDSLGWADRFASPAFTARQAAYMRVLHLAEVYTPQMIVNGHAQFVGSDAASAKRELQAAFDRPQRGTLTCRVRPAKQTNKLLVDFRGSELPHGVLVCFALVEGGLETKVERGENRGRTLHHESVVRSLTAVHPDDRGEGTIELSVPPGVRLGQASVICFAQDPATGEMSAATRAAVPK